MGKEDIADEKFPKNLTDRERAAFELGIKLGALFHMSMGIPVSKEESVLTSIENAFQKSIECQPYVSNVKVKLIQSKVSGKKEHQFDYSSIYPECLSAKIIIDYKGINIEGKIEWNEELNYPLMYISKIE
ncbi:MAG: dihydroneopterin aldolase [archaeon]|nr:dihydroneopterin aldolase [archaeon]